MRDPHKLTTYPTGPGKVHGKCSCGRWQMTGYETSVKNTHRQHRAREAEKN